jgi:hypothetical protein
MISMQQVRKRLESSALLPLWPEVGEILGLSRNATYDAAARGDIKTIPLGRLKRVPSVWLKSQLGLDGAEPLPDQRRIRGGTPDRRRRRKP